MYQYLECTPESLTTELIDELRDFENDGLYPPRFKLLFQNQSGRHAAPLPVMITLNGLVDGSVPKPHSITVILGMSLNLFSRRYVIFSLATSLQALIISNRTMVVT